VLALLMLAWLRSAVPVPHAYEGPHAEKATAQMTVRVIDLPRRFWAYTAFTAVSMAGFATFAVLAYHQEVRHVIPGPLIPVTYAAAMGAAALAALGSGWMYDRVGLTGLLVALPLAAAVPFLAFSLHPTLVWIGVVVWGAVMGVHESTMRAAVADLVPRSLRGTSYGIFTAAYGVAWLAGSTIIGLLYEQSLSAVITFTIFTQLLALLLFLPVVRDRHPA
jgi:predicted MFS family arabinose efflux permease